MNGEHFKFVLATDAALLRECFRLRYEVYCLERRFLDPAAYADGLEQDEFDPYSLHFACQSLRTGQIVGTIRLVARSELGYPLLSHCHVDVSALPENTMEISRLAVSRMFRRRVDDNEYGISTGYLDPAAGDGERRRRPEIVLGLYRLMYQESKRRGVSAWLAAMELSLVRLLGRMSFKFEAVGPEVDYYGPVTPYLARIDQMENLVRYTQPSIFSTFTEKLP